MDKLVIPDHQTLCEWMDTLHVEWFECDSCQALHLPAMQNFEGVFDARLEVTDNILLFTARAEVRPSALLALAGELSEINSGSLTAKTFLDIQDETLPKLIVSQSLDMACGITQAQFGNFMQQSEVRISMIILEAFASQRLMVYGEADLQHPETLPVLLH